MYLDYMLAATGLDQQQGWHCQGWCAAGRNCILCNWSSMQQQLKLFARAASTVGVWLPLGVNLSICTLAIRTHLVGVRLMRVTSVLSTAFFAADRGFELSRFDDASSQP